MKKKALHIINYKEGLHVLRLAVLFFIISFGTLFSSLKAQINTTRLMNIARNSLYYEDYVLSIQYFNMIISAKPHMYEPWFYRGLAKFYLDDYSGSEADCTEAIERNPYASNLYELRGLVRINQKNYKSAAEDYYIAVKLETQNKSLWHNLVLCEMENDSLHKADSLCNIIIKKWSKYADGYCLKANIKMQEHDSANAEIYIDKALAVDKYNVNALTTKGSLLMNREEYADAEKMYSEAIRLYPKNAGVIVNRALCKFHQNNYRGAMKDYDLAIDLEPSSFIAHYNRGLLLANVGEDNKAIEDFNFIINVDSTDMMAIFNRGELYMQTGDYSKAIKDYTTVINEYPKFLYGYQRRAEAKRKVGDKRGADKDESHVIKETVAHKYGYSTPTSRLKNKTRKKSERNIDDYNKLVEDDNVDNKYESQYRGKIQNKPVEAKLMPRIPEKIKQYNDIISKDINILFYQAYEKAQTGDIGDAIIDLNKAIELNPSFAEAYYNRGLLKLLIDDVSPAIMDLSKAGELGIYSAYNIIKKNQNKKM